MDQLIDIIQWVSQWSVGWLIECLIDHFMTQYYLYITWWSEWSLLLLLFGIVLFICRHSHVIDLNSTHVLLLFSRICHRVYAWYCHLLYATYYAAYWLLITFTIFSCSVASANCATLYVPVIEWNLRKYLVSLWHYSGIVEYFHRHVCKLSCSLHKHNTVVVKNWAFYRLTFVT